MFRTILSAIFVLVSFQSTAQSTTEFVVAPTQKILMLRVEGKAGFLTMGNPFSPTSGCGGRVWINLSDEVGRVKYSTAMMAFASERKVTIRANNSTPKLFNECELYDIVVH